MNTLHCAARPWRPAWLVPLLAALHLTTTVSAQQVEALPVGMVADDANIGYFNSPIQSFGTNIYVAFVEPQPGGRHRTRVGKWDGKAWTFATVEEDTQNNQFHTQPSLAVDRDGYVHVVYNMHSTPWQYSVSRRPEDISEWAFRGQALLGPADQKPSSVVPGPGTAAIPGNRITYPYFTVDRNGTPYVTYRESLKNEANIAYEAMQWSMGLARYDLATRTWQRVGPSGGVFPFATEPDHRAQGAMVSFDRGNRMHVSWNWYVEYALDGANQPNEIAYARSLDGGMTFTGADGRPLTLPVAMSNGDRVIGPEHFYGYTSVMATSAGKPYVWVMPMESSKYGRSVIAFDSARGWSTPIPLPWGATSFAVDDDQALLAVSSGLRLHVSPNLGRNWVTTVIEDSDGPYDHWLDRVYFRETGGIRLLAQSRRSGRLTVFTIEEPRGRPPPVPAPSSVR